MPKDIHGGGGMHFPHRQGPPMDGNRPHSAAEAARGVTMVQTAPPYIDPQVLPEYHIRPHANLDKGEQAIPTFTMDEAIVAAVTLYANTEWLDENTQRTGPLESLYGTFLPTIAVSELLGYLHAPVPDTPILCEVVLRGRNIYTQGEPTHQRHNVVFVVFDGKTGDLVAMNVNMNEHVIAEGVALAKRREESTTHTDPPAPPALPFKRNPRSGELWSDGPPGVPGITPTSYSDDLLVPHFTADEAIAFVQASRGGFRTTMEGERTIDGVRFALPQQFGDPEIALNYHPSRLLCAVWSHGMQTIHGGPPSRAGQVQNRGPRLRDMVNYFDAKTGNILGSSSQLRPVVDTETTGE